MDDCQTSEDSEQIGLRNHLCYWGAEPSKTLESKGLPPSLVHRHHPTTRDKIERK